MKKSSFDVAETLSAILERRREAVEINDLETYRASLVQDVDAAQATGDQSSIDLTGGRLAEFDGLLADVASKLPTLDAATADAATAVAAHDRAFAVDALGSIEPKTALANANALTVARGARIVRDRELGEITASTWVPLKSAQRLSTSEASRLRAKVLEQTRGIANQTWSEESPEYASEIGRDQGTAATAKHEAWWMICEEIVRREHAARAEELRAQIEPLRQRGRVLRVDPDAASTALERAFAARRGGLAASRAQARARNEALAINA